MTIQKKSVLGRGLGALIPQTAKQEISIKKEALKTDTGGDGIIARISVNKIHPNPFQPRVEFDSKTLEELKESILAKGVIQPITVRRKDGAYELISGERRLRAVQKARLDHIPAYILKVDTDEEMIELSLIENLQREQLNPIEIAVAFQSLIETCSLTQEEVASRVGKDRSSVTNFLRLLKLPQRIQIALRRGDITMGHARPILSLSTESEQLRFFDRIVKKDLSVRQVENIIKAMTEKSSSKTKKSIKKSESKTNIETIENKLRVILGTKVSVRSKQDGKGDILIDFYSYDDLDRLLDLFAIIDKHQNN